MSSLNVVCLISGGKDSFFSILHCKRNGHNVVALANLHPPYDDAQIAVDDLESYMYQTIGHTVIPLYEQALNLPLYRQEIYGSAVNQDKCYGPSAEDEAEALIPLLRKVKAHHPEVNAVSTGAILSDYQRTRVESIALRLGLTPLAYLWQYPNLPPHTQTSLLEHMAAVGQDSRIIKVASGGLDESFLWQNVADRRTIARLDNAARRFGSGFDGAALGEGGEYETLAVAGPSCLWKGRIVVDECNRQVVIGDAGSASLHITGSQVSRDVIVQETLDDLKIPPLLEPQFETILSNLKGLEVSTNQDDNQIYRLANIEGNGMRSAVTSENDRQFPPFWANIVGEGTTAQEQMRSVMEQVLLLLRDSGYTMRDVAYTAIILRDMADFAAINAVYSAYFIHPNPPARVTLACAGVLPPVKHLCVSFTLSSPLRTVQRKGLHVQSRSYWAPANIGPYSQAISIPLESDPDASGASLVYIAGQIPLVPQSMELAGSGSNDKPEAFSLQTALALQHAVRIGKVMNVKRWASAIAFITASDLETAMLRANIANKAWGMLHQSSDSAESDGEEAEFDVWDLKYGVARGRLGTYHSLEEHSDHIGGQSTTPPPLHVIRVDALPRGASIEWAVYGLTAEAEFAAIPQLGLFLETFSQNVVKNPPTAA